ADFRGSLTNLNGVIDMRLKPYVDAVEMLRYEGEQSLFQYSDDGQGGSFFKLLGDAATRADFSVRSYADLNTMMDWITGETNHDLDYRLTFNVPVSADGDTVYLARLADGGSITLASGGAGAALRDGTIFLAPGQATTLSAS